jgi:hypothetical protein
MTPKEKAKELVNNFYQPLGYLKCGVNNTKMWQHAKEYALMSVNEIFEHIDYIFQELEKDKLPNKFDDEIEYWNEVKKEIELL